MFRLQKGKTLILATIVLMFLVAGCSSQTDNQTTEPVQQDFPEENSGEMKTFVVTGGNYWFEIDGVRAPEIKVNAGDKVRIEFTSVDGFHDWVADEFDAATQKVKDTDDNPNTFVEFVADKAGIFEYYCSVGNHRENGMVGTLVVE